nr:MAG TPA: hypothetical protein [Caudoviricetes sp.]
MANVQIIIRIYRGGLTSAFLFALSFIPQSISYFSPPLSPIVSLFYERNVYFVTIRKVLFLFHGNTYKSAL